MGQELILGAFGLNVNYLSKSWYEEVIASSGSITVVRTRTDNGTSDDKVLTTEAEKIEYFMEQMLSNDKLPFANDIFKTLLVRDYFSMSRNKWDAVFGDDYRDKNNLDSGKWVNIHQQIQTESDFPTN